MKKKNILIISGITIIILLAVIIYLVTTKANTLKTETDNNITKDLEIQENIVNVLKNLNANDFIDKSTVSNSANYIRDRKINYTTYSKNQNGKYIITNINLSSGLGYGGVADIYKELEYEPMLYMNKDEKKLIAVKTNTVICPYAEIFYKQAGTEQLEYTTMKTYVDIETFIIYDITAATPEELKSYYRIEISKNSDNFNLGDNVIAIGYGNSSLSDKYLIDYYDINGNYLLDAISKFNNRRTDNIQEFNPSDDNIEDLTSPTSTSTGIAQAVKDGKIGEDILTEGISEEWLKFLYYDGNLQFYYETWDECLQDAQKLNIINEDRQLPEDNYN